MQNFYNSQSSVFEYWQFVFFYYNNVLLSAWTPLSCSGIGLQFDPYTLTQEVRMYTSLTCTAFEGLWWDVRLCFLLDMTLTACKQSGNLISVIYLRTQNYYVTFTSLILHISHLHNLADLPVRFFRFWLELLILIPVRIPRLCLIPVPA